jgi:predicted nucleic acid-binding protein
VAEQYRRPYLDSSVFLSWLKGEVIVGIDRGAVGHHLMALAERGIFPIVTSALTLAEVHKLRSGPVTPNELDESLLAFFEHDYMLIVDADRSIGEEANRLCRKYGIYPMDAVHLASALRARCDVLLAWDNRFAKVSDPVIRIEEPQIIG